MSPLVDLAGVRPRRASRQDCSRAPITRRDSKRISYLYLFDSAHVSEGQESRLGRWLEPRAGRVMGRSNRCRLWSTDRGIGRVLAALDRAGLAQDSGDLYQ